MTDASDRTPRSPTRFARRRVRAIDRIIRAVMSARSRRLVAIALLAFAAAAATAGAAERQECVLTLWGDGRHDDTKALNAWFKGDPVVWAENGRLVAATITGHDFLLTSTVYIPSGTGRRLEQFQMFWPARKERVSGGTIFAGDDPDKPAVVAGIVKTGAGPGEGVPYPAPPSKPGSRATPASCLVSSFPAYSAASAG
jgi:hypothetical protein